MKAFSAVMFILGIIVTVFGVYRLSQRPGSKRELGKHRESVSMVDSESVAQKEALMKRAPSFVSESHGAATAPSPASSEAARPTALTVPPSPLRLPSSPVVPPSPIMDKAAFAQDMRRLSTIKLPPLHEIPMDIDGDDSDLEVRSPSSIPPVNDPDLQFGHTPSGYVFAPIDEETHEDPPLRIEISPSEIRSDAPLIPAGGELIIQDPDLSVIAAKGN